jgi:putative restriction endonuclease
MTLDCLIVSPNWNAPIFKVLAHNDTGTAPGNQAGVLIPKALRSFFPGLVGVGSRLQPTIDQRVDAELFVESKLVGTVNSRYQFQTWSGTRPPESRLTDQLGAMRDSAQRGDVLVMQSSTRSRTLYRLTLIRKSSRDFKAISRAVGSRRWGTL